MRLRIPDPDEPVLVDGAELVEDEAVVAEAEVTEAAPVVADAAVVTDPPVTEPTDVEIMDTHWHCW